jgi:hypothetical protein
MKNKLRELLIDEIMDFSGDEYEDREDYVRLAKKSTEDLVLEIIDIAKYFRDCDVEQESIQVDHYYYLNEDGKKVYDVEEMTTEFHEKLSKLAKN